MSAPNTWAIDWTENLRSDHPRQQQLSFPTGDEAYRMAGVIADRQCVSVRIWPPSNGLLIQPSFYVEPRHKDVTL